MGEAAPARRRRGGERWRCPHSRRPRGYLNNPEATTAVIDPDGWLTIVDRVKELIKCKGLQVAPAELEAILMTHPQVADCAVIVPDEEAGEVPKAFVVLRATTSTARRSSPSSPGR